MTTLVDTGNDIPGFEGLYRVTECGKVWSVRAEQWMKLHFNLPNLYLRLNLKVKGVRKAHYIHRLVALTYLNPPPNWKDLQVRHMDGDKQNNNASNLRWGSNDMNLADKEHHARIRAKLSLSQEEEVLKEIEKGYDAADIAKGLDVEVYLVQEMEDRCSEADWYF